MDKYAFVIEINGIPYYRNIDNPKEEIKVVDGEIIKLTKKIKELVADGNNI